MFYLPVYLECMEDLWIMGWKTSEVFSWKDVSHVMRWQCHGVERSAITVIVSLQHIETIDGRCRRPFTDIHTFLAARTGSGLYAVEWLGLFSLSTSQKDSIVRRRHHCGCVILREIQQPQCSIRRFIMTWYETFCRLFHTPETPLEAKFQDSITVAYSNESRRSPDVVWFTPEFSVPLAQRQRGSDVV